MKKRFKGIAAITMASVVTLSIASSALAGQYKVVKGDCLCKIAPKFKTTWQTLADMNKLANPNLIFPGQILNVPDVKPEKTSKTTPAVKAPTTTVKKTIPAIPATPATPAKTVTPVEKAELTGLGVKDISMTGVKLVPDFSPEVTEYTLNVQDDIYGVMVTPQAENGEVITVDGTEVKSGEGKVVQLAQDYDHYGVDYSVKTEIKVVKGNAENTYKITINRANAKDAYALFKELSYEDKETGLTIPYELYVPSNYDATKTYPVVFVLHGAGQRTQSTDMLLKRYQSATVWATDSEAGTNECIVLSPQCNKADGTGWTDLMKILDGVDANADPYALSDYGKAAYNLLHAVEGEYSCDLNRIYMTGLSMGGFGTFALAIAHPDEFAAIVPVCGGADPKAVYTLKDGPAIWIFHAKDDPTVDFAKYEQPTLDALNAAAIKYKSTIYSPGEVFYPSAHFAWTPAYADKDMRTWLFEQSKK